MLHPQVIVYSRVVFLKIGEIDTLKENFMADAFIQSRWREPLLDHTVDALVRQGGREMMVALMKIMIIMWFLSFGQYM